MWGMAPGGVGSSGIAPHRAMADRWLGLDKKGLRPVLDCQVFGIHLIEGTQGRYFIGVAT